MKITRLSFVLLASAVSLFTSCLNDNNNNVTYYEDTAITSFTLGSLKWNIDSVTTAGKDTVYRTTLDGKAFSFYIDQYSRRIYNPDSLPHGVDGTKVICTVSSKNAGIVLIKSLTSDSLRYFSNTDSIDFSQPRTFRVYSNSQQHYREYTISVNIHKQKPDVFKWDSLTTDANLAALTAMKAVTTSNRVFVFGRTATAAQVYSTARTDGKTWAQITPSVSLDADAYKNVAAKGDTLFLLNSGNLLKSLDGQTWQTVATLGATAGRLLGVSNAGCHLTGTDGNVYIVKTTGTPVMTADAIGSSTAYLPATDINLVTSASLANDSTDQLTLLGNRDLTAYPTDAAAVVWGKVSEYSKNAATQAWTLYTNSLTERNLLPRMENLQVVGYGRELLAFGGNGVGGSSSVTAFSQMYLSSDGGLSWSKNKVYALPNMKDCSTTSFTMTVDADNYIWLICGGNGKVWKVRKNSMGWTKPQTSFTK